MHEVPVASARVEIVNVRGLHARAAAALRKLACRFGSDITVLHDGQEAEADSIMSLLMLAAAKGSVVEIRGRGGDAAEAVAAIADLTRRGFGEDR